ncbi:Hsp20 family protein [Candidatus Uhrbacteria bacterium]|nr:Hsp20 family protein [Candidatus Uhrbacteria bacterium]
MTNLSDWMPASEEGQLSVDVFREGDNLVIRSLVAGVKPDDLDISVHGDLLTIRGKREHEKKEQATDWFYEECYWGAFSRSIVLPYHVSADATEAKMKNGILEIRIPIRKDGKQVKVEWDK